MILKMARRFIIQPIDAEGHVLPANFVIKLSFLERYGLPLFTFGLGLATGAVWGLLQ
jgi:hypothetical protein